MKNMILIIGMLMTFTGCDEEKKKKELDTSSIYGTWQYVAYIHGEYTDDGFKMITSSIKNGYTYTIKANKTFESTRFNSTRFNRCKGETYFITDKVISFQFNCESGSIKYPCLENSTACEEDYYLKDGFLYFNPKYNLCAEVCTKKFRKIAEQEQIGG